MIYLKSKFHEFRYYLAQADTVEKGKLEALANELIEGISKSNEPNDVSKELTSLANSIKKIPKSRIHEQIKVLLQAERVFKACEQKGIEHTFTSELERSIKTLENQIKEEGLLEDIDDKKLGFMHGDIFLSASGFEGGDSLENIEFVLPYLKTSGLFSEKKEVITLLEDCVAREKAMSPKFDLNDPPPYETFQKQSEEYSEFLCDKIKNMQEGQRFLLTGGWHSLGEGHSMFYIVEKGKNGKYAFTVVNPGAGIHNHQAKEIELKTKYKPILRLCDIDEPLMANKNFFLALNELRVTLSPEDGKTPWNHDASDIYDRIIPALQGKRDIEFETQVDFVTDQRSGTCSWMSLMKLLRSETSETKRYKQFNFALRRDSLEVYFNKLSTGNLPLNGTRIELLKRCTESFAQNSVKQHKNGVISQEELKGAQILVRDIQVQVKIWESSSPIKSTEIDLSQIGMLQGTVLEKELFKEHEVDPSITLRENIPLGLSTQHRLETMPETLDQFQIKLERVIDICKTLRAKEEYRLSEQVIVQFVTSMGSYEKFIDRWTEGMNREKIEKTMASVLLLSQLFLSNLSGLPEEERGSPEHFAFIIILAALNVKLGSKINSESMLDVRRFITRCSRSPYFILFNTELRKQFDEACLSLMSVKKSLNLLGLPDHRTGELTGHRSVKYLSTGEHNIDLVDGMIGTHYDDEVLKKEVKDFSFLEKFRKGNPDSVHSSDRAKLLFAFRTWGTEQCPFSKQYQILNEMEVLITYFFENPNLPMVKTGQELLGNLKIRCSEATDKRISISPELSGRKSEVERGGCNLDSSIVKKQHLFSDMADRIKDQGLKELITMEGVTSVVGDGFNMLVSWNSRSNLAVTIEAEPGFTRQNTQHLAFILSNEKTKIPNLVAYFQENPELLSETDYQFLFMYQLFSGRSLNEMMGNPLLLDKIFTFVEEQYALQKGLGNIQQQLFFLSFADHLRECARGSKPDIEIRLALDIRKEFSQIVSSIADHTLEGKRTKALCYQHYIASFYKADLPSEEECQEIYKGFAYVTAFGLDKNLSFPHTEEKMGEVLSQVNQKIALASDSFHKKLLQQISEQVLGIKNAQWAGKYPHFHALNGRYKIHFNPLTIFEGDTIVGPLPEELMDHPNFQKVIGKIPLIVTCLKPGVFELTGTAEDGTRLKFKVYFSKKDHSLQILKEINNGWYTYIPDAKLDGKLRPASLVQGHHHWFLIKDYLGNAEMVIESEKGKKCEFLVELSRSQDSYQIMEVRDLKNEAVLQDLYHHPSQLSSHLNDFQPIDSVFLGKDHGFTFSSLGIAFTMDEKKQLIYSKNPDFHLATVQKPPKQLPHFSGFLEMEGNRKKRKFLIPKGVASFSPLDPSKSQEEQGSSRGKKIIKFEPGKGPLSKAFKMRLDRGEKAGYYEISEKNGKLVGNNPEENLYIACLHLAHKNYEEANALLKQSLVGRPKEYSEREAELIDQVVNLHDRSNDHSPQGLAMAVKALYLQMRNTHKIDPHSLSILVKFYPVAKHAKQLFLSPDEELELLEYIEKNIPHQSPVFKQRLRQLKREPSSGEKADEVPKQGTFILPIFPTSIQRESGTSNLLHFPKIQSPHAQIYFGQGAKYFDKKLEFFLQEISSENPLVRKKVISEMYLLNLEQSEGRSKVRDLMILFALQSSDDDRRALHSDLNLRKFLEIAKKFEPPVVFRLGEQSTSPVVANKEERQTISALQSRQREAQDREIPSLELDHAITVPTIQSILAANQVSLREVSKGLNLEGTHALMRSFDAPKEKSKVEQTEYLRVQKSIEEDAIAQGAQKYYLFEEEQIQKIHDVFEKVSGNYATKIESQKKEILKLANRLPADPNEAAKWQLKLAGKKKKEFTIDDVIICLLQNNGNALIKQNPHLADADIKELMNLLHHYLINCTEAEHLKRVHQKASEVLQEKNEKKGKALLDLNILLRTERSYEPHNEPAILVFEYYSTFRLKEPQVQTLRSMILKQNKECNNLVPELIMGSGKTKVILPLLAFLNSRGDNVPIILTLDELFEKNLEDMRALSGELLNQEIETIEIKKEAALTIKDMKAILQKFERVKKRRSYCLVNQTTVSTLYLHYKEIVTNLPNEPEKYLLMKQIMNTLGTQGDLIIDETDMVLDCLKEMNFSRGGWKNIDETIQTAFYDTFSQLVKDPVLDGFFNIKKESEKVFDEKKYETVIKPHLAKMFIKMAGLQENETLINYLLSAKEVREVPRVVSEADDRVKAQLALGKELIKNLFPLIMSKNCNEHFGLSHIEKTLRAIPYTRSDTPSEGSEFGTPYETLMYTMLYYTRMGVTEKQLKILIDECKAEALAEYQSGGIPLNQTKGYQKFAQLNLIAGKDLFSIQESELKEAAIIFNESIENKMRFAKLYGWSEVGTYPERLSCNPQDLVGMFRSVQGFTGTLWNKDTFPSSLRSVPDTAVDGKTINILKRSAPKVTPYPMDLVEFFRSLAGYDACIDVGAWFRGLSCMKVAETMLENLGVDKKGVVYLNDVDVPPGTKGQAVILERGSQVPKLLSQSNLLESERFTYYNVTTGVDIPQHALAKALVTVSKTVTLRDLLQGVWRMRDLDKMQKCDFAIPEELCKPDLENILHLGISNQARRQRDDNLRSLRQQMSQFVEHMVNLVLLSPNVNVNEATTIVRDAKKLFVHESENDLYTLFGGIETKVPIKQIVELYFTENLTRIGKLYEKHAQFEQTLPFETLKSDIKDLIDYDLLPEEDYESADLHYGLQMKVRSQIQVEQQSKKETKVNLETIDDAANLQQFVGTPKTWECRQLVDLYSPDFHFCGRESVNDYLDRHKKQLTGVPPALFSNGFFFSDNFTLLSSGQFHYGAISESRNIPFQTGSKPGGVSALQVGEDGTCSLTFLHPSESEVLSLILNMEKHVDYEKLSKFTTERFAQLIVEECRAYLKEELESGRVKETLREVLITNKFEKEWIDQVVSKGKFDKAWLADCLKELPNHVDKEKLSNQIKAKSKIECATSDLKRIVESLDEGSVMNCLLDSFKGRDYKNSSDRLSLKSFYAEYYHHFPGFEEHMEKRLLKILGLDQLRNPDNALSASQLFQLFSAKDKNKLLLVHPILGVIETGNTDVDQLQLDKNPSYIKLMAEAKFYMGVLNGYKPEEKAYLASWIKDKGPQWMESFLLKHILSVRASTQRKYETSALKKIIDSCGAAQSVGA